MVEAALAECAEQRSGGGEGRHPGADHTDHTEPLCILDLGTGTGCIGLSVLHGIPPATPAVCVGLDLSEAALSLARANAARLRQEHRLPDGDGAPARRFSTCCGSFGELHGPAMAVQLERATGGRRYDLVVSNPPYLTRKAATETLSPSSIAHEPREAFVLSRSGGGGGGTGGTGGEAGAGGALAAYSAIGRSLQSARERGAPILAAGGSVVLEVPPDRKLHRAVKAELEDCGLAFVREFRDGAGMRRGLIFRGSL